MNPLWTLALGALCVVLLSFLCGLAAGFGLRLGGRSLPRPAATVSIRARRHATPPANPPSPPSPAWSVSSRSSRAEQPAWEADTSPVPRYWPAYREGWYPQPEESRR